MSFTITYHSIQKSESPVSFGNTHVGFLKRDSFSGSWFFDLYDSGVDINSPAFQTKNDARRWAYIEFPRKFAHLG